MLNLLAWSVALVAMPAAVIGNFRNYQSTIHLTPEEVGLFESLSRIVWSICLSYMIFACAHGSGGAINRFLSLSAYQPLAKLSFTIYLIHILVLIYTTDTVQRPLSFSETEAFQSGISVYVISAIVAIPLVLAFELPIDAIYKLTMITKSKRPPSIPISIPEKFSCVEIENSGDKMIEKL